MQDISARSRKMVSPLLATAEYSMFSMIVWLIKRPNLAHAFALAAYTRH